MTVAKQGLILLTIVGNLNFRGKGEYVLVDATLISRKLDDEKDTKKRPERENLKELTLETLNNLCSLVQLKLDGNFVYEANENNTDANANLIWTPKEIERLTFVKQGNFGRIFIAKHSQMRQVFATLKIVNKKFIKENNQEAKLWAAATGHPHISQYFGCFKNISTVGFVSEYVRCIPLQYLIKYCGVLPQNIAAVITAQVSSALIYMHKKDIFHRNINIFNIKISVHGISKIEDFGAAVLRKSSNNLQGLWQYAAPEIFEEKRTIKKAADWYPVGICLYEMLTEITPMELYCKMKHIDFEGLDFQGQLVVALSMELYFVNTLSKTAIDILVQFLKRKPTERLGYRDNISQFKNQLFFEFIDWNLLEAGKLAIPLEENYNIELLIDRYLKEENKRFYL